MGGRIVGARCHAAQPVSGYCQEYHALAMPCAATTSPLSDNYQTLATTPKDGGLQQLREKVSAFSLKRAADGSAEMTFQSTSPVINVSWANNQSYSIGSNPTHAVLRDSRGNIMETTHSVKFPDAYGMNITANSDGTFTYSIKFDPKVLRTRVDLGSERFLVQLENADVQTAKPTALPQGPQSQQSGSAFTPAPSLPPIKAKEPAVPLVALPRIPEAKHVAEPLVVQDPPKTTRLPTSDSPPPATPSVKIPGATPPPIPAKQEVPNIPLDTAPWRKLAETKWEKADSGLTQAQTHSLHPLLAAFTEAHLSRKSPEPVSPGSATIKIPPRDNTVCTTVDNKKATVYAHRTPGTNQGILIAVVESEFADEKVRSRNPAEPLNPPKVLQVAMIQDWEKVVKTDGDGGNAQFHKPPTLVKSGDKSIIQIESIGLKPTTLTTDTLSASHPAVAELKTALQQPLPTVIPAEVAQRVVADRARWTMLNSLFRLKEQEAPNSNYSFVGTELTLLSAASGTRPGETPEKAATRMLMAVKVLDKLRQVEPAADGTSKERWRFSSYQVEGGVADRLLLTVTHANGGKFHLKLADDGQVHLTKSLSLKLPDWAASENAAQVDAISTSDEFADPDLAALVTEFKKDYASVKQRVAGAK